MSRIGIHVGEVVEESDGDLMGDGLNVAAEDDKFENRPLHEAIVFKAREAHLAGATVLRGPMGFGQSSRLHTTKILRLSQDLPIVIEIVDTEQKIKAFLPTLDAMMPSGLITLEKVQVLQYGKDVKHDPA